MKIVEVIADAGHKDTIHGLAEQYEVSDVWCGPVNEDGRISVKLLLDDDNRQAVLDSLQSLLQAAENSKIVVSPVEAVLPKAAEKQEDKKENQKKTRAAVTREEIYSAVEVNSRLHRDYILLVILSSIVASAGLLENNVAVIIGAMVIAPLLGPNIAFAFGTSLGDRELVFSSLTTIVTGISVAIAVALMPPAVTIGLMLSDNSYDYAKVPFYCLPST